MPKNYMRPMPVDLLNLEKDAFERMWNLIDTRSDAFINWLIERSSRVFAKDNRSNRLIRVKFSILNDSYIPLNVERYIFSRWYFTRCRISCNQNIINGKNLITFLAVALIITRGNAREKKKMDTKRLTHEDGIHTLMRDLSLSYHYDTPYVSRVDTLFSIFLDKKKKKKSPRLNDLGRTWKKGRIYILLRLFPNVTRR